VLANADLPQSKIGNLKSEMVKGGAGIEPANRFTAENLSNLPGQNRPPPSPETAMHLFL
jgi:hypothetical protein